MRCVDVLICPVCGEALFGGGRALRCRRNHSFDRSREGYVDLLPPGYGRSKVRGDTAAMVHARRRFLGAGAYERLSDRINDHVTGHLAQRLEREPERRVSVLDVGCGEGYYSGRLRERFTSAVRAVVPSAGIGADDCFFGLDISRAALRLAARRYPDVQFFVNDVQHRICMAAGSADVVLNAFAPRNPAEFARVVRRGGLLVIVIPREGHLAEIAAALPLLEIDTDKQAQTIAQLRGGFEPVAVDELEYTCALDAGGLADVVHMSPSYHHVGEDGVARARALGRMEVTVRFSILCLSGSH